MHVPYAYFMVCIPLERLLKLRKPLLLQQARDSLNSRTLQICGCRLFCVDMFLVEPSLIRVLGMSKGLQQTKVNSTPVVNNVILSHIKIVLLQYHIILLKKGSSESRMRDASYSSGIPAPDLNSARCSSTTLKQAVGTVPSCKPLIFRFKIWVSEL